MSNESIESAGASTETIVLNGKAAEIEEAASQLGYRDAEQYLLSLHQLHLDGKIHVPRRHPAKPDPSLKYPEPACTREMGTLYHGDSAKLMLSELDEESVDLIVTSPPFGLLTPKPYGNEDADEYIEWFEVFARGFKRVLKSTGSLVIDIGGAWQRGRPTRSLYHFELMTHLCRTFGFYLAQEFYWWNPAKLPLPAEWVNIRRIRVRDSVNCVWWLSKTPYPRASNKRVLQPYSKSMEDLFERGSYNTEERSGGHKPGERSFLERHGGSIPHNLISLANTESNGAYQQYCQENDVSVHPARFPSALPAFFIRMLTDRGDVVLDPFAGSCITGVVAEQMERQWICCELEDDYVQGGIGRFRALDEGEALAYEPSRTKPYFAYPPSLAILTEDESPLPEDGGRHRPKR